MKMTPLDVRHHKFGRSFHGLCPKEVSGFLEEVRVEWEELIRQNQKQQEEIDRLTRRLSEYQEKERILQETLLTVQKLSDDLKNSSQKEAEIMLSQAQLQADKILRQAHDRLTQVIDEINELKKQRAEFEAKMRGLIQGHLHLLELHKETREGARLEDVGILPRAFS